MYGAISRHPWLSFAVAWVVVFVSTGVASYLTAPGSSLPRPPFGSGQAGQLAPHSSAPSAAAVAGGDSGRAAADRPRPGPTPAPPAGTPGGADRSRAVLEAAGSGDGPAGEPPEVRGTRTPPDNDPGGHDATSAEAQGEEQEGQQEGPRSPDGSRSTGFSAQGSTDGERLSSGPARTPTGPDQDSQSPEPTGSDTSEEGPTSTSTATTSESPTPGPSRTSETGDSSPSTTESSSDETPGEED